MASNDNHTRDSETPWEHTFHEKFLTLNFTGYLMIEKQGFAIIKEFLEKNKGLINSRNFRGLADVFDSFIDAKPEIILKFTDVDRVGNEEMRKEYYRKVYHKYLDIELERCKCLANSGEETKDEEGSEIKYEEAKDFANIFKYFDEKTLKLSADKLPEEDSFINEGMSRGFKFLFGRSDHRLVASLVKAIWSMKQGDIKIVYVPREQLLSVDLEEREIRELTLQLYPHKPVYKRRDKDAIRGWEEMFPDGMPWCMVPGGRALSKIIDADGYYKKISKQIPATIFTEDKWLMDERKRIFREERKKDVEKSVLKGNDPRVQVNHFLPILKEITGFRGRIRDESFYTGFQGLIYIIQVREKDTNVSKLDLLPHFKSLIESELTFRKEKKKKERREREEKLRREEETEEK